jgi:hypothetical protein
MPIREKNVTNQTHRKGSVSHSASISEDRGCGLCQTGVPCEAVNPVRIS